jgi:hypothetical protein
MVAVQKGHSAIAAGVTSRGASESLSAAEAISNFECGLSSLRPALPSELVRRFRDAASLFFRFSASCFKMTRRRSS